MNMAILVLKAFNLVSVSFRQIPLLHLKREVRTTWEFSSTFTSVYLDILHEIATSGQLLKARILCAPMSVRARVVKGFLSGGAHIIITTCSYNHKTVKHYQSILQSFGGRGSVLTMDLDYIIPFAGIPENDREINGLDERSELVHRRMFVNLL